MNWLRNGLIGGIFLVAFLLFIEWNEFQERQVAANAPSQETLVTNDIPSATNTPAIQPAQTNNAAVDDLPDAPIDENAVQVETPVSQISAELIHVKTDALDVLIDPLGGDIIKLSLPKYLQKLDDKESMFNMLNRTSSHTYIAESGLVGKNATHTRAGRSLFNSASREYVLNENEDTLAVDLTLQQGQTNIIKRFTFTRDSYLVDIRYIVENKSGDVWQAAMYGRIKRDDWEPPTDTGFGMQPFLGGAITTADTNFEKFSFDDLDEDNVEVSNQGGWVAMIQHYFVSAWVPNKDDQNKYVLKPATDRKHYFLGYTSPLYKAQPGETIEIAASFYSGPKNIKALEKISPYLDLTLDFGWLWFIAKPLFLALAFIQTFVGNWGVAIILLTVMVKIIFFYPSAMSYRSMAKMRKVMPLMQELKERYGDDRQRMGVETMKLYKKEGVNPLGGCLPMLMQMPVFIALYWALMESVELRHSPFFFWIQDLSVKDPFFILPLIFGASMFFQQKLNPAPADPTQAKIMQMMPIFFTFLFMMFPSGLVLYWVTNNCLSIAQQYVITKQIENADS